MISVGYGIVCEWRWRGQTIGKRMLRLRVMDRQGLRLQPSQIVIRNLLRFADGMPAFYLLGGVTSLINRHGQRLGDIAANTVVVRTEELPPPGLSQVSKGRFNSLAGYPHLAA
ncbi:MAG TPA: RDD family protein [Bryobacteraceae bacterium]|nr:RDD family protein [Bryobacteraceae bacterium]